MKIAIVGSGTSGRPPAYYVDPRHAITVYKASRTRVAFDSFGGEPADHQPVAQMRTAGLTARRPGAATTNRDRDSFDRGPVIPRSLDENRAGWVRSLRQDNRLQ